MSDAPQGPGWWQASDDKWYPPPRPAMPGEDEAAAASTTAPLAEGPPAGPPIGPSGPPPAFGTGPGYGAPSGPGFGPPPTAPMGTGPYGVPGGPPPGGGQNRTPLIVALAVVAVLAVVGIGIAATSGGDDGDDPVAPRATLNPTSNSGPEQTAATTTVPDTTDGGGSGGDGSGTQGGIEGIEVTETGVTNFADEFDGTNRASYAYVLTNTGDEPVANMEVTVTLVDTEGTVLSSDSDTIYLLQPGQTIGLGDTTYDEIAEVDAVEVQPAIPSYASPAEELGEVTVEGINTTADSSGYLTTTFTATSSYEVQLDSPWAYVVYRNSDGTIVGGAYGVIDIVPPGGSTSGEVSNYTAVPGVDPAQTEVYIDPGYL